MNDQAKRGNALSDTGKQFYTWGTMGTFSATTGVVLSIWTALKGISPDIFSSEITPLVTSFVVVMAFALFTEPPEEKTTWRQKSQKAVITIVNSFLIYSTALGFTGAVLMP